MTMRRLIIALGFAAGAAAASAQQDAQYSMYMFNQLSINPAYAGSREVLSTALIMRNQWTGISGAPKTSTINVHGPLKKRKVGLGIQLVADEIGPKKSSGILGTYAYHLPVGNGKLAMGLRGGVYAYTYNWSLIDYKDKADIYNTGTTETNHVPTIDAGAYYHTKTWYAGLSTNHLLRSRLTAYENLTGRSAELKTHLFLTGGKAFQISDNFIFNPSLMMKYTKNAPVGVDVNLNVFIDEVVWAGVSIRPGYGFILLGQYQINNKLKLGYAFDAGMNRIGVAGKMTHELLIQYDFNIYKSKTLSPRYL
jgi:type IX secretion system PorP/SprF family membrane protein